MSRRRSNELPLRLRRLDDDGDERGVDRAGERWPPGVPPACVAGLPSTRTSTRSVTSGSCWPASGVLELSLDPAGDEPQGQLAQGGQVRLGEELLERDLGPLGRIDVAVLHPLAQGVRAHVDELDLVRGLEDLVGEALVDRRAGDRRDRVGDALEVLDVHRADDVDAGVADDLDVLPALVARRPGHVGVGELVDQRDRRLAREDGVGVHLLDDDAAVLDPAARHDLEAVEQLDRVWPAVGLDEARRRGRSRGRPADAPPRASGTSCRRPAPCPCRPAAGHGPCPVSAWTRASISSPVGRTSNASRSDVGHRRITPRAARRGRD